MKQFLLLFFAIYGLVAAVYPQNGSINNVVVEQRSDGSGILDVYFNLSGTGNEYNISLEASFDAGNTYFSIAVDFLSGDLSGITPGSNKHIVWDGQGSFPDTYSTQSKLKIIAVENSVGDGQPCPGTPTVTDFDGNIYNTVLIGDQCWMAENLNTTKDASGNNIIRYCYDNSTTNCDLYGGLYDWTTLMNGAASSAENPSGVQGICPNDWHVPSDAEWTELTDYIINNVEDIQRSNSGDKLKSCWQINSPIGGDCNRAEHPRWNSHDIHFGTDDVSFGLLPGGYYNVGTYGNLGSVGYWWTATLYTSTNVWHRRVTYNLGSIIRYDEKKTTGFSLRCVKDCNLSNSAIVETDSVFNVTPNSADVGGKIVDLSGLEIIQHGHCWAETPSPTVAQSKTELGSTAVTGLFTSNLTGLNPKTNYFVRSYVTTSEETEYGNEISFTTLSAGGEDGQPCPDYPTITDIDGNTYNTVLIGDQCWMAENLSTTKDASGNTITRLCYDNSTTNCNLYGGLYNWTTIMNGAEPSNENPSGVIGICPNGWHLPSDNEWVQLISYLDDEYGIPNINTINGVGNALKSCRQINSPLGMNCNTSLHPRWDGDDTHYGTNSFGFAALPGGAYLQNNSFLSLGYGGIWWSTSQFFLSFAGIWTIYSVEGGFPNGYYSKETAWFSVRCLKD